MRTGLQVQAFEVPATSTDIIKRQPGAFHFLYWDDDETPSAVRFACPCGCGRHGLIHFVGHGRGRPEWTVRGEWPNVTLNTPVFVSPVSEAGIWHWYGTLIQGMFFGMIQPRITHKESILSDLH